MSEWSEKVTEIMGKHVERKKSVEDILTRLLNELRYRVDFDLIDTNNLKWEVHISLKTFTLTNEEILSRQEITRQDESGFEVLTGEMRDLEEVIQELILEKIS